MTDSKIVKHYSTGDLKKVVQKALEKEGLDSKSLSINDLAPVDEFHIRGRKATNEMAQKIDFKPNDVVLDVGCGIGGTSRYVAQEYGCKVVGIDLTPEYIKVAKWINGKLEMDNLPEFRVGDATNLTFEDYHFDVVFTEHVNMNIEDKKGFINEMYRVLKPGGKVGFYEILAGNNQPAAYPVPWSETGETSYLASQEKIKDLFKVVGFKVVSWEDTTDKAREWYQNLVKTRKEEGPPPLGIHLFLGELAPEMFRNLGKNLKQGRISIIQAVLQK